MLLCPRRAEALTQAGQLDANNVFTLMRHFVGWDLPTDLTLQMRRPAQLPSSSTPASAVKMAPGAARASALCTCIFVERGRWSRRELLRTIKGGDTAAAAIVPDKWTNTGGKRAMAKFVAQDGITMIQRKGKVRNSSDSAGPEKHFLQWSAPTAAADAASAHPLPPSTLPPPKGTAPAIAAV
jgi:hypothetical protein